MFSQQHPNNNVDLFLSSDLANSAREDFQSNYGFRVLSKALGLDDPLGALRMILSVLDVSHCHLPLDETLRSKLFVYDVTSFVN